MRLLYKCAIGVAIVAVALFLASYLSMVENCKDPILQGFDPYNPGELARYNASERLCTGTGFVFVGALLFLVFPLTGIAILLFICGLNEWSLLPFKKAKKI